MEYKLTAFFLIQLEELDDIFEAKNPRKKSLEKKRDISKIEAISDP